MFAGPRRRHFEVKNSTDRKAPESDDLDSAIERLLDEGKKLDREELKSAAQTSNEQLPTDNTP